MTFGKVWLFRCQSRSSRPTLLPPLQPNCVFLCKGTKLQKATLFALFGLSRILGWFAGFRLGVFSRLCEPAGCVRIQRKLNSGLWLTVFGKSWLFRCQSTPVPPMLCFLIWNRHFDCRIQRKLNSGLWRTAFGK